MKFFHFNKSLGYIITTLFCIVFLCASYFFIYLPENEKTIQEQRFRTLQNIDRNIHEKIENSVSLLNNIISAEKTKDVSKYIDEFSKEKFSLKVPPVKQVRYGVKQDSSARVEVSNIGSEVVISLRKEKISSPIDTGALKFSFTQFVEYLLPDDVFDQYVIFSGGNTVFETFPSGLSTLKEDSIYKLNTGLGGSLIRNIVSGGKDYKLFLHEVNFKGNNRWIIGGLLSNARYNKERSQLPISVIMLLTIIVLGIIVIFPWIKLYHMGSKDRLTLADGLSIILVSMILMSLLFLCLFKYNRLNKQEDGLDSKKILSKTINTSLYNEIRRNYAALSHYDSIRRNHHIQQNISNFNERKLTYNANPAFPKAKNGYSLANLRKDIEDCNEASSIQQIFWLNDKGEEKYNWASDSINAPLGNFSARKYFKNIIQGKPYYLDGNPRFPYFLDQVVSWTTGVFTSILSIKSIDNPELAVSASAFTMTSLDNTLLPAGYSFAIIDNTGKVLYHSKKSRNLNENIKLEFSDSSAISSAIESRTESEFIAKYYSKSYSVFSSPVEHLPYTTLIFSDQNDKEIRDVEVYSFTLSMFGLHFLYMLVQISITFFASSRRSFFKKQLFDTSWIGPNSERENDYAISFLFNLLVIVILISNFQATTFFFYLFLSLVAINFVSLFFNLLLFRRYIKEKENNNARRKLWAIAALMLLLLTLNVASLCLLELENRTKLLWYQVYLGFVAVIFVIFDGRIVELLRTLVGRWLNYIHCFCLMILSTLIITNGIPIAFFYLNSYNYETKLDGRYRQNDFANRILAHKNIDLDNIHDTPGLYVDGTYVQDFPTVVNEQGVEPNEYLTDEKKRSFHLLGAFRLMLSDKAVKTDNLSAGAAADSSVKYHPGFFDKNTDNGVYTFVNTGYDSCYVKIKSSNLNYKIPAFFNAENFFQYWIWLVLALIVFYIVLLNIIKKLFCLNLPALETWEKLDEKILTDNKLNKLLFVIGLPGAGKITKMLKKIRDKEITCGNDFNNKTEPFIYDEEHPEHNNVLVADLINIPDLGEKIRDDKDWISFTEETVKPKYKLVIFNHFEYNIQDHFTNGAKLEMLESIMQKSKCKVIILSTVHPVNFLDSLNDNNRREVIATKKTEEKDKNVVSEFPDHDLERWHVLLGHYRIVIMPLTEENKLTEPQSTDQSQAMILKYKMLSTETNFTHFLHDMQPVVLGVANDINAGDSEIKTDELALKLQISAHYFYMYIWQSLTKEEKFLLYDLAEDNLVNSYDDYNLIMLIAKGVIIKKTGSLRFFNRGFRNFILTAIGNTEVMKIKDRIKENGNWGNLRIPLIIVIIAILGFLLISQQEAYSKLIAYVAALSAGIPVILKIFSLLDKNTNKAN